MKILAVETSHDDTSVVIYKDKKILKELSYTQTEFHKQFGGTVPEYAARGHLDSLQYILGKLNDDDLSNLNMVAYTALPGLIGSLHMGKLFAQAIALALSIPIKPINHMHGHIFAAAYDNKIELPAIALIVSGGHTQLWNVNSIHDMNIIGETMDDAVGEVYDKIARRMKLGFPGGPVIDSLAKKGISKYDFKLKDDKTYDFSFSGLKTKIINKVTQLENQQVNNFEEDISASFQDSIIDILEKKTKRAIEEYRPKSVILGGGVSANSRLREEFAKWHNNVNIPGMKYTTDNAMMIAIVADLKGEKW